MSTTSDNAPPERDLSEHMLTVRTAVLIGAAVAGGLMLNVMIVGSAPRMSTDALAASVPSSTTPQPITEAVLPGDTTMPAETTTEPLPSIPVVTAAGSPVPAAPTGAPAASAAAASGQGAGGAAIALAPSGPSAERPSATTAPAATTAATTVATTKTPGVTTAPTVSTSPPAPATTATTVARATTSTSAPVVTAAPTTAAAAPITYPNYTVSGIATVTLRFDGSSISVSSVAAQTNWVYKVDLNGPGSVEIKFFNVQTQREGEFHAALSNGRITVESAGAA